MDDFCDAFLAYCQVEKGLSGHTLEAYSRDLQRLFSFFEEICLTPFGLKTRQTISYDFS